MINKVNLHAEALEPSAVESANQISSSPSFAIAVGVSGFILLLMVLASFYFLYRQKKMKKQLEAQIKYSTMITLRNSIPRRYECLDNSSKKNSEANQFSITESLKL